jgi:mRNA-degrading endonuclease RelE of RelBE toxin-antitoxin system
MKYTLYAENSFQRSLKKLPSQVIRHIRELVLQLAEDPRLGEPLRGEFRALWSLHTTCNGTSYRVVYSINDRAKEIVVHYVASRENFYAEVRRLQPKKVS